jgi:hypothetical protein
MFTFPLRNLVSFVAGNQSAVIQEVILKVTSRKPYCNAANILGIHRIK